MEISSAVTHRFTFHGRGAEFALLVLKNIILTILTLGVYHFWAKVNSRRYLWQASSFAGARFVYHGTPMELFKARMILFAVILVSSLGVFALSSALGSTVGPVAAAAVFYLVFFFAFFVIVPFAVVSGLRYRFSRTTWRGIRLGMKDCQKEYVLTWLKGYFLTIITLGIYASWWHDATYSILVNNTRVGTLKLRYTGKGADLMWTYIRGFLLSLVTFGIYSAWFAAQVIRYRAEHTYLGNATDGHARAEATVTGGEIFVQFLLQYLLLIFTLGLALPWIVTNTLTWSMERLRLNGRINFDAVAQKATEKTGAFGDGIGDALDLGLV